MTADKSLMKVYSVRMCKQTGEHNNQQCH